MTGKKFNLFCLSIVMTLGMTAAGCSSSTTSGPAKDNNSTSSSNGAIRVGLIMDVTGGGSALGVPERNAVKMLVDQTNASGGINGKKIELIEADNQSNETKALTEAKRLINEEKVDAIIGGAQSTTSLAMVPAIEAAGVPYISNGSNEKIIKDKKWSFRTPPSDNILVRNVLKDAKAKGIKKIALLRVNNDYGKSGETAFKSNAAEFGIQITGVEQFNADDKDIKVQLTKLLSSKPDALAIWAVPPGSAVAAKDFNELGLTGKIKLYGSSATSSQKFIDLAGPGSEGIVFPTYKFVVSDQLSKNDPQYDVVNKFKENYEAQYKEVSQFSSNAADAWYLLADAIKNAGKNVTRQTIRDNLETAKGVMGQIGEYNMKPDDHNGLDGSGLVMVSIQNGKFVLQK
jgi:branched-chain amino acid transport system substrate-binding protein